MCNSGFDYITSQSQHSRGNSVVQCVRVRHTWLPQHCSNPAMRESARDSTANAEKKKKENRSQITNTNSINVFGMNRESVFYLQWGKDPRHTALLRIVTRNMWQFLKSDSILSMDSILQWKNTKQFRKHTNTCTSKSHGSTDRTDVIGTPTSRLQIQLAIGLRRWGRDWEPSLLPPSQNWPEETGEDHTMNDWWNTSTRGLVEEISSVHLLPQQAAVMNSRQISVMNLNQLVQVLCFLHLVLKLQPGAVQDLNRCIEAFDTLQVNLLMCWNTDKSKCPKSAPIPLSMWFTRTLQWNGADPFVPVCAVEKSFARLTLVMM